jgi:microcin C transport system substrate-binding protein
MPATGSGCCASISAATTPACIPPPTATGISPIPTYAPAQFDVDKALEAFARAGFTRRDNEGVLVNDAGQRLAFTLTTGYENLQDVLTIMQQEALQAGLLFRVEVLDGTAAWKKVQEKQHDIQFVAFNVSPEMFPATGKPTTP